MKNPKVRQLVALLSKTVLNRGVAFVFCLLMAPGCGTEVDQAEQAGSVGAAQALSEAAECPIPLEGGKVCAKMRWIAGPKEGEENSLEVAFFDPARGNAADGPFDIEGAALGAVFEMTCCGSESLPRVSQPDASRSVFLVDRGKLWGKGNLPGEWRLHLKLDHAGDSVRKVYLFEVE